MLTRSRLERWPDIGVASPEVPDNGVGVFAPERDSEEVRDRGEQGSNKRSTCFCSWRWISSKEALDEVLVMVVGGLGVVDREFDESVFWAVLMGG